MKKIIKWLTTSVLTLLTLLALGIIYIAVAVDPNQYRGDIETIADQNGVELSLNGDLEWQFFPLGIRLNQVNYNLKDQSIAGRIDQLWLGVSILSMLANSEESAQLPVNSLSIEKGRLFISRANQLPLQISDINLKASNIALDGREFPLSISLQALGGIKFNLDTELGMAFSQQRVSDFSLSDFSLRLGGIKLMGEINSSEQMAYISGQLQTNGFDLLEQLATLQQLIPDLYVPEMVDPQAFKSVSITSNFSIERTQTSEIQTQLVIDNQPVDINVLIDEQRYKMTTMMSADNLDLSAYLIKGTSSNGNAALFAPLAIPLALWHGKSQVEVHLGQLQLNNLALSNIYINLFGNRNVFKVNSFAADAFEGQIDATATLDLRGKEANFNIQSSINNLNLESLLGVSVAQNNSQSQPKMQGLLDLTFNLQGSGNQVQPIVKSLSGTGQLQVLSPYYKEINIEQTLCSAVAMLSGKQSDQQWAEGTQLNDLTSDFRLSGGRVIIDNFQTGAGNIDLSGKGSVNLIEQVYRLNNTLWVAGSATSETGCSVNAKLQNRDLPFVCEGRLGEPANCRPDASLIKLFLKESAVNKLSERVSKGLGLKGQNNPVRNLLDRRLN